MAEMRLKLSGLLDFVFPRRCPVCGDIIVPQGELCCLSCRGRLKYVEEPYCLKCGKQLMPRDLSVPDPLSPSGPMGGMPSVSGSAPGLTCAFGSPPGGPAAFPSMGGPASRQDALRSILGYRAENVCGL